MDTGRRGGEKGAFNNMFGRNQKQDHRAPLPGEIFPSIDFNALGKQLRLEVRGLKNGRAGHPDSGATEFDPVENEIVNTVDAIRRQGLARAADYEKVYRDRITDGGAFGPGIREIANNADTDFRRGKRSATR